MGASRVLAFMGSLSDRWPIWLGGVPAGATFLIVLGYIVIQYLKNQPLIQRQNMEERLNVKRGYKDRIKELEFQVDRCHEESRRREYELQSEIDALKEKMNNEAWQRVQSEISLVSILLEVVEAPQMKAILDALKVKQARMPPPYSSMVRDMTSPA
jgi:hypothetical protein